MLRLARPDTSNAGTRRDRMRLYQRNPSPSLRSNLRRPIRPWLDKKVDIANGTFTTVAPTSDINATASNELVRYAQLTSAVSGIDATTGLLDARITANEGDISALESGKVDSSDLTAFAFTLLSKSSASSMAQTLGCPYIVAQEHGNPVRTVGVSSTAYETLWSYTIPGSSLGMAQILWQGDCLQNAGGNTAARLQLNGTTIWGQGGHTVFATDADYYPLNGEVRIAKTGTNTQLVSGNIMVGAAAAPGSGGRGWWVLRHNVGVSDGTGSETETADMTLALQVQFSTSAAAHEFRLNYGVCTVFPA